MVDIKFIRNNQDKFLENAKRREINDILPKILALDEQVRYKSTLIQKLRQAQNEKSEIIKNLQDKDSAQFKRIIQDAEDIKHKIQQLEHENTEALELKNTLDSLPNMLDPSVPDGIDESSNQLIKTWGEKPKFDFRPKSHAELGEKIGLLSSEDASKMSGSRFIILKGLLARMERALINMMLDVHTREFGFTEMSLPYLVKPEAMYNAGQLPKFHNESFVTEDMYRLIPTGEVPLVNLFVGQTFAEYQLPKRLTAITECFRKEAGSHGRDVAGLIRLHQFKKVELVSITTQDDSDREHMYLLGAAETILQRLELHYQIVLLCSGDTGFASQKTFDMEVWFPEQNKYREIASCSNCGEFQSNRMQTKYNSLKENKKLLVHTLNSSALPIGRTMAAIMENYQNEDGSITIPKALINYMNGLTRIPGPNSDN